MGNAATSPLIDQPSEGRERPNEESRDTEKETLSRLPRVLMKQHKKRDPMEYFEVLDLLGEGSMGSVSKCRKRGSAVGGSARPQNVVRKQPQQQGCCFHLLSSLPTRDPSFVSVTNIDTFSGVPPSLDGDFNPIVHVSLSERAAPSAGVDYGSRKTHRRGTSLISYGSNREKFYALKSIAFSPNSKAFRQELENEVSILQTLDHPNIVKAIETYDHAKRLYLVLEMCSGGDLNSRSPYTEAEAARIMKCLLSAISYLHSKGIVHRDLKFENCMFANESSTSEVKIIDFGLSEKCVEDQYLSDQVGTIYTMAPELLTGKYDFKADIWSLGVIAFKLLCNRKPFYGKTRREVVRSILEGKVRFKGRRWSKVSLDAKEFVLALLKYSPDLRPSAEEALEKSAWMNRGFYDNDGNLGRNGPGVDIMDQVQAAIQLFADYSKLKKLALMVLAYKATSEEIGYLRNVFANFDKRCKGEIDLDEFKSTLAESYTYTEQEVIHMFRGMDVTGTGSVHYCEFLAATIEAHGSIEEDSLAEAFDRIDTDDTGYITAGDLMEFLGKDLSKDFVYDIIHEVKADTGRDNRIDYEDFLNLWNYEVDLKLSKAKNLVHMRHSDAIDSSLLSRHVVRI